MAPSSLKQNGLISALVLLVGLALLAFAGWQYQRAQQSRTWPTVPGTVEATWIREDTTEEEIHYFPGLRYTYQVAGERYQGTRIRFGSDISFDTRTEAKAFLARYPEGGSVTVHYNPADPSDAVLEPTAHRLGILTLVGGLLTLGGLWSLWNTFALWRWNRMLEEDEI